MRRHRRRNIDDRARLLLQHAGQECLDRAMHRLDVEIEREVPVLFGALEYAAVVHVAGAVDEHVERAVFGGDLLGEGFDRRGRTRVELQAFRAPAAVELALVHVGCNHARAFGRERLGDRTANSLSCRRDQRDLALQTLRHQVIPPSHAHSTEFRPYWFTPAIAANRVQVPTSFQISFRARAAAAPCGRTAGSRMTTSVIVSRYALLRDPMVFDRGFEHHAVGELIDHGALDLLPRRLARRVAVAALLSPAQRGAARAHLRAATCSRCRC